MKKTTNKAIQCYCILFKLNRNKYTLKQNGTDEYQLNLTYDLNDNGDGYISYIDIVDALTNLEKQKDFPLEPVLVKAFIKEGSQIEQIGNKYWSDQIAFLNEVGEPNRKFYSAVTSRQRLFTMPTRRLLFIHGLNSEGHCDVWQAIQNNLPDFQVDTFDHPNDPIQTKAIINKIDLHKYQAIIGHSLGSLWALTCPLKEVPIIMINPGYCISKKLPEFRELEQVAAKTQHYNTYAILGTQDPHLKLFEYNYKRQYGPGSNIIYFNGGHVPSEQNVRETIIPLINKMFN